MPNAERILDRMRTLPVDFTVKDLIVVMEFLEWEWRQGKGSHMVVRNPVTHSSFTIGTVNGKTVKRVYLRMLLQEIDSADREN